MTVKSRALARNIVDRFSLSIEIVKLLTCDSRSPNSLYYCLEGKACLRMKPTQNKLSQQTENEENPGNIVWALAPAMTERVKLGYCVN